MDKQPKLIDADKLLEWLDVEIDLSEGNDQVLKADRWAFRAVKKEVESGRLDADPTPVPTIKPGDRAVHSDLGQVRVMDAPVVSVLRDKAEYEVYLSDLEVVE